MSEIFNSPLKKITTGFFALVVFGGVYFMIRKDEGKTGACISCCTASGTKVCKPNFSKALCREYSRRLVDGRSWEFVETPLGKCPN